MSNLWEHDESVANVGLDVPRWIDQDVTCADVAAIVQGGCASGAYMPAVTYHVARETMAEHGDEIFSYLEDSYGFVPDPFTHGVQHCGSWDGMACFFVSAAVELWASGVEQELTDALTLE